MQSATHIDGIRHAPANRTVNVVRADTVKADSLSQSMHLMGATMAFPRNTEIFGESEPADYLYKVVSGSVRTYKILSDGRRQVGGFYLPGDIFGLEFADAHTLSAEAITDCKVLVVKRSALNALAGRDASVAQQLLALTGRELRRVQDRDSTPDQVRAGTGRELSSGNGGTCIKQHHRAADVAPRHRRLSRFEPRDRLANPDVVGNRGGNRGFDVAAHCTPELCRTESMLGVVAPQQHAQNCKDA